MEIALAAAVLILLALVAILVMRGSGSPDMSGVVTDLVEVNREAREADAKAAAASLAQREAEIRSLTEPIKENLERVQNEVADLNKARQAADGAITSALEQMGTGLSTLGTETANLKTALRRPDVRGRWGEVTLKRCVELGGMTEHVDYVLQETIKDSDVWLRPDALFRMPGGRTVVADSKVPLEAYLSAIEAEDENERRERIGDHIRQARKHISDLASKRYEAQFQSGETPDFVICFFPLEPALQAAWEADPELYEWAFEQGVVVATPTTLIGLLRVIEFGWRQERLAENAQQIADASKELHERFAVFFGHLSTVGKRLESATKAFNETIGSSERRILPSLRRIEQLGAAGGSDIEHPEPIETAVRKMNAPEASEPTLLEAARKDDEQRDAA